MTDRQIKIHAAAQILQGFQKTKTDFETEIDYYVEKSMLAACLTRFNVNSSIFIPSLVQYQLKFLHR